MSIRTLKALTLYSVQAPPSFNLHADRPSIYTAHKIIHTKKITLIKSGETKHVPFLIFDMNSVLGPAIRLAACIVRSFLPAFAFH